MLRDREIVLRAGGEVILLLCSTRLANIPPFHEPQTRIAWACAAIDEERP
jgi:hypothetical protein